MAKRNRIQKRLAIDFDGVLHRYSDGYRDGRPYDQPVVGAVQALTALVAMGFTYIVFTSRVAEDQWDDAEQQRTWVAEWLAKYGFPMPEAITASKWACVAYIDDRAIRFTNWNDVRKLWG